MLTGFKALLSKKSASIAGILWDGTPHPGQYEGYPVFGTFDDIRWVIERNTVDMLLIATPLPWYSIVIEALGASGVKNLTVRWVPHDLFTKETSELPQVIPLMDFSVKKTVTQV